MIMLPNSVVRFTTISAVVASAAIIDNLGITVYSGNNCQNVNEVSTWTVPTNGVCIQPIPGKYDMYAMFNLLNGTEEGVVYYYYDSSCEERDFMYDAVYSTTVNVNESMDAVCKEDVNRLVSIWYEHRSDSPTEPKCADVAVTTYSGVNCPSNVLAYTYTVPTDGTCTAFESNTYIKFVGTPNSDTGDLVVYTDSLCTQKDSSYNDGTLEDVNVGINAKPVCRSDTTSNSSYRINPCP
eukprot:CFRG4065T1